MTAGSIGGSVAERKFLAARSRWWNSTGGGSATGEPRAGVNVVSKNGKGNIRAGDGGAKFRSEWPELDGENWKWMRENKIDLKTGKVVVGESEEAGQNQECSPETAALRRTLGGIGGTMGGVGAVVQGGREAGRGWSIRRKWMVAAATLFVYVLVSRLWAEGEP